MSLARKQALISGVAWLIISGVFVAVVAEIGVAGFTAPTGEKSRDLIATVVLPGYLINFALIWRSRRGRKTGDIDERDKVIEHRATEYTALTMLVTIFVSSIAIFEANADLGTVPAGWFFLLAYGSIALVSLVHPILTLILDYTGSFDG